MSSQTSLVAKQCRIQSWALQIKDCQNRPVGMTVGEWCIQNNITKADYYYRLKCVRQACLDSMESTPAFFHLFYEVKNNFHFLFTPKDYHSISPIKRTLYRYKTNYSRFFSLKHPLNSKKEGFYTFPTFINYTLIICCKFSHHC